jgi:hypothetical protein
MSEVACKNLEMSDFWGLGGELAVESDLGSVFHQGRDVGSDPACIQRLVFFRDDAGDEGSGCVRVAFGEPVSDFGDGVVLFGVVHYISLRLRGRWRPSASSGVARREGCWFLP